MFHLWHSFTIGDVSCGDRGEDISDEEEEEEDVDFSVMDCDESDQSFDIDSFCGGIVYRTGTIVHPTEEKTHGVASPLNRLLVVLDLDETLVHAQADPSCPHDFCVTPPGMYVQRRPGAFAFLRWLAQPAIEVAVYTAGLADYARTVVAYLDPESKIVSRVLSRADCVLSPHGALLSKDLRKLTSNLQRVVLVDNNPMSFLMQPRNGILVKDFRGQCVNDDELDRVKGILEKLLNVSDVREALRDETELEPMLVSRLFEMPAVAFAQCPRCGIFGTTQDAGVLSDVVGLWYCETCRGRY